MKYIYRYTDLTDGIIKYVGIVYSENRSLSQRINEHKRDYWYSDAFKVEYIAFEDISKSDLNALEGHYICVYKTYKWFNESKNDWGESKLASLYSNEWIEYIPKEQDDILSVDNMAEKILFEMSNISDNETREKYCLRFKRRCLYGDKQYDKNYWQNVVEKVIGYISEELKSYKMIKHINFNSRGQLCVTTDGMQEIFYDLYNKEFFTYEIVIKKVNII